MIASASRGNNLSGGFLDFRRITRKEIANSIMKKLVSEKYL